MRIRLIFKIFLFYLLAFVACTQVQAQSLNKPALNKQLLQTYRPAILHFTDTLFTKNENQHTPQPLQAGATLKLNDTIIKQFGQWIKFNDNLFTWYIIIRIPEAKALNVYFKDFQLSDDDKLFVYSYSDTDKFLGAFTRQNNDEYFSTGLVTGNTLVIELNTDKKKPLPFKIKEIGVISYWGKDFGNAGSCEVPVNCPEGKNWQKQKSGVTRILVKEGAGLYWCTGSLINNTKRDGKPYILTANHCGQNATAANYAEWVFDFNYESPDCSRPATEPEPITFTGSSLIAHGETPTKPQASDFKLLLLDDSIPGDYHLYFNGWDRRNENPVSGVVIHHPQGDIKFISTYDEAYSTFYYSSENPEAPYWKVYWKATESGHGVTEGGSSGSPLFNKQGLIAGTLTGGDASCENNEAPDYFGKFSTHWDKNGNTPEEQLKPWLDPENTGALTLNGFYKNQEMLIADFYTDVSKVSAGSFIRFYDNSEGTIKNYHWTFEGGEPEVSEERNPLVYYPNTGKYMVKLVVTSDFISDSTIKENYVEVIGNIFPNPFVLNHNEYVHILVGDTPADKISVQVFDSRGKLQGNINFQQKENEIVFKPTTLSSGIYIVFVRLYQTETPYKLVIVNAPNR